MYNFAIKAGRVAGRDHVIKGKNCQDALSVWQGNIQGKPVIVCAVADGCGSGEYSEVGSRLAVDFITGQARNLVAIYSAMSLHHYLYQKMRHYLMQVIMAHELYDPREQAEFINDHLLFTLIVVVIYKQSCQIMYMGDGLIQIDESRLAMDHGNRPPYIGYDLIDPQYLSSDRTNLQKQFGMLELPLEAFQKLAIGTDAWYQELDLLDQVWDLGEHPNALQRKMRVWSNYDHRFSDDAALITIERQPVNESKD